MQKTEVDGKVTWTTDTDGGRFTITKLDKEHPEYGDEKKVSLVDAQDEAGTVHYFKSKAEATKHINHKQSEKNKADKAAAKAANEPVPASAGAVDDPESGDDEESEDE